MVKAATILECLLCQGRFSLQDVKALLYFPSTGICRACYIKGKKAAPDIWCFGKRKCYNKNSPECSSECPDRKICPMFFRIGNGKKGKNNAA